MFLLKFIENPQYFQVHNLLTHTMHLKSKTNITSLGYYVFFIVWDSLHDKSWKCIRPKQMNEN